MKLIRRSFLFFAAVMFALSLARWLDTRELPPREQQSVSAAQSESGGYLVRSEGDRVCVVPATGGHPLYLEGVKVSDLPEADRLQLAAGFALPDDDALLALLEDYTG